MGNSASAIIWYGYAFPDAEENAPPWRKYDEDGDEIEDPDACEDEQQGDAETRLDRLTGLAKRKLSYEVRERERAKLSFGCEVVTYGANAYDFTSYGVAITESVMHAHSYDAKPIEGGLPKPPLRGEDDAALVKFCELMGIDVGDQKPQWWVASSFG